ncbi:MAG: BglG family transcription antiterminator [Erysipelotrichia bacterium]|nr:BglG family transcription antiterminator [Erysipelotrichia bacterium]NCC55217.1 BglG family transcription antiterminator [Erysipelotrichia bacterium]
MDNDILVLMHFLSKKSFITLADIEHTINITKRQAVYRIEKLNDLLKNENVPLIATASSSTKNIRIEEETRHAIHRLLQSVNQSNTYYLSKKERLIYMYLMLFMNSEYLTLNDFINCLQVSRSTILLDFKELLRTLEERGIQVRNNRKQGYYLVGSEMEIRRIMMKYVTYTLAEEQNSKVFDVFIDDFHLDIFDYSRLVISELAQKHNIRFVEDRLVEFIYIFIFLKARMQSGKDASQEIIKLIDIEAMSTMKEYEFSVDLLKNYKHTECITNTDINYIAAWILGISFGDINDDTKDCILISDIIGKIMTRFESLSGAHYKNTEEIFIQLYSHFRPAYYRLLFKLPIFNPLCEKVKEEYKELYQLVEETMKPFHVIFGEEIPADEIAYLTMHFAMIYSDKKDFEIATQKVALVVCSNGIGSSAILYNELTGMFPELHFLPPMESAHIQNFNEHVDIIFTTSYISHMIDASVPIIRVSPVMSIAERYQVVREVYAQLGSSFLKQPSVDEVMKIVAKYADIQKENALYTELITYFSQIDNVIDEKYDMHLKDMVQESIIRLHIKANDWEEAVRKSYEPMVNQGFITQNYVEETVRSVKLSGPYIVITKHVALPHARPEAGALSCALGIGVLEKPIVFGNEDNDPVKYIFSLSATDNETHLCAMAELVELFNDTKFYQLLDNAQSTHEIMEYLEVNE